MADASGLMFFVLRVRPDVALEFVNDAPGAVLIGDRTTSGSATDVEAEKLLGQIDPDYADRLSAVLALPPHEKNRAMVATPGFVGGKMMKMNAPGRNLVRGEEGASNMSLSRLYGNLGYWQLVKGDGKAARVSLGNALEISRNIFSDESEEVIDNHYLLAKSLFLDG
jgi:hypothetical protein